jgi:hypothetical protein
VKTVTISLPIDEAKLLSRLLYEAGDAMPNTLICGWINEASEGDPQKEDELMASFAAKAIAAGLLDQEEFDDDGELQVWQAFALFEQMVSEAIDRVEKDG